MEEKEEIKLKILLLIILSIPIIISLLFIIGVNKVYAANYMGGWTNQVKQGECTNKIECDIGKTLSVAEISWNKTLAQNNDVVIDAQIQLEFTYYEGLTINTSNPILFIRNQGGTINANHTCTYTGTQTIIDSQTNLKGKRYIYNAHCEIPNNNVTYNEIIFDINITPTGNQSYLIRTKILDNGIEVYNTPVRENTGDIIQGATGDIINNNNSNTQSIINNNDANTGNIINNAYQNTQDIINNQNSNSQAQIDKIDESFNTCDQYDYNNKNTNGTKGYLISTGDIVDNDTLYYTSKYIKITKDKNYTLNVGGTYVNPSYCLYDESKNLISCTPYNRVRELTITPTVNGYIRYSYNNNSIDYKFKGEYCYNRLDGKAYEGREVDKEKAEAYLIDEQELLDIYNRDQLDIVDISVDTHGNQWVWDRIVQFMNTNEYIRLMIISILSLGVIKLVLAR